MRQPILCLWLTLAASGLCQAQLSAQRRNWFDDPFFQISVDIPDCPLPAGPFRTEAERRTEAHHRAEQGTSCWLAGQCERPNSYAYDHDIAAALQAALVKRAPFSGSSLWVTVQARVVYIEGCAVGAAAVAGLEAFARGLPYVQQALVIVRTDPVARPPYRLRSEP